MAQENGNGHNGKPIADFTGRKADPMDPTFISDDDLAQIPDGLRDRVKIRIATLAREAERGQKFIEKQQPRNLAPAAPQQPEKPAKDPNDVSTWSDKEVNDAVDRFEQWEAAYAADPTNERAKAIVTDMNLRREVAAARREQGRRDVRAELAPDREAAKAREQAGQVLSGVWGKLQRTANMGGAEFQAFVSDPETQAAIDEQFEMFGKTRETASAEVYAAALTAAVHSRLATRDGGDGMTRRGRPEIDGEGFGSRARAQAPDDDAEVSALLTKGDVSGANRKATLRFLTDPSYQPPKQFMPQTRAG